MVTHRQESVKSYLLKSYCGLVPLRLELAHYRGNYAFCAASLPSLSHSMPGLLFLWSVPWYRHGVEFLIDWLPSIGRLANAEGETLSLCVTLPHKQKIEGEGTVQWSRGNEFAVQTSRMNPRTTVRLRRHVKLARESCR
jgi:hypothetical protein